MIAKVCRWPSLFAAVTFCKYSSNNEGTLYLLFGVNLCLISTVSFTDLDQGSEMIIFESILTTFKESVIYRRNWGGGKNWLEPKIEPVLLKSAKQTCIN
jgi:hypothetical protein